MQRAPQHLLALLARSLAAREPSAALPAFLEACAGHQQQYCSQADSITLPRPRTSSLPKQAKDKLQQGLANLKRAMDAIPEHHLATNTSRFGARFTNPWSTWEAKGFKEAFAWQRERKKLPVSLEGHLEGKPYPTAEDFAAAFPLNAVDWDALANPPTDAIQACWVGHATVLVQMGGLTFITDPCFSERCSPVQWAGPKRVVPSAIQATDPQLPNIDFVLLSHNHYDHLDADSVKALYKRFGDKLTWYVPLGVKAWFKSRGIRNVVELDWWQEVTHAGSQAQVTFVPAQHWSARGMFDRQNTLWGGYVVKTQKPHSQTFCFTGDTGYCPVFTEIGKRLGPMDLSAIPIGAYEARWFLKAQHVDAVEGLQIHKDVQSKRSIAIHCCTWGLSDEPLDEPPRILAETLQKSGGDPSEFVTLQHGALLQVRDGQTLNQPKVLPVLPVGAKSQPQVLGVSTASATLPGAAMTTASQ